MNIEKDFEEFIKLLNKHKVKYCIVGSYAVAFHRKPRYTKDVDVLIEPDLKNSIRILAALKEFGFGSIKLREDDFLIPERVVQLGFEPVRIDILTSLSGVTFNAVWLNKKRGMFGNEKAYFIGINELIKSKIASRRLQDKADLELLQKKKNKKKMRKTSRNFRTEENLSSNFNQLYFSARKL